MPRFFVSFTGQGLSSRFEKYTDSHAPFGNNVQKNFTCQSKRTEISRAIQYLTFFILAQGLVWCCYYLALAAFDPNQVDYATGMSQLIVSVLTIVSIGFAFFEFLRKK